MVRLLINAWLVIIFKATSIKMIIGNYFSIFVEWKNIFEIIPRSQPPVTLAARSYEEKSNWMGALVMLTTKRFVPSVDF